MASNHHPPPPSINHQSTHYSQYLLPNRSKLNASAAQAELVRVRALAEQQAKRLKSVEADRRAIEGRMRHQAHKLQEAEKAQEVLKEYVSCYTIVLPSFSCL